MPVLFYRLSVKITSLVTLSLYKPVLAGLLPGRRHPDEPGEDPPHGEGLLLGQTGQTLK